MPTPVFLIVPTGVASLTLRRYVRREEPCPGSGYHNAVTHIGTAPILRTPDGMIPTLPMPADDPRWPTQCAACGYVFIDDDARQCTQHEIYAAPDGRHYTTQFGDAPPGAMWVVEYITPGDDWCGPDGQALMVVLPAGDHWLIDGPSSGNGPGWSRTGTPPAITARPSILTPRYHGWLTDGVLSDDLEGRSYP